MKATLKNILRQLNLDDIGLVIIGVGASLLYYIFEKIVSANQDLTIFITICLILLISVFTQILLNSINQSRRQLHQLNETLEQKVRERTAELHASESRYRTIFENTGTATIIINQHNTINLANTEFTHISGFSKTDLEDRKSWVEFIDEKNRRRFKKPWTDVNHQTARQSHAKSLEGQFIDKDQKLKNVLISLAPIPESEHRVVSLIDITALKEAEQQIYHQAFHDNLTNLPNRELFLEHLAMAMKRAALRSDYHFAVLYLDIDRFKLINDSLGHTFGNKLLVDFANRLLELLRDIDTMARLGGDEFVILLEDIEEQPYATLVAQRMQDALREPFFIEGHDAFAQASIGIVLNTRDYDKPENIIRDADAAMYHAKEKGRAQFQVFDPTLHEKATRLLQIETDLRKAIKNNEFELYYQPIVSLDTEQIIGLEALIRWNHPKHGVVYPDTFIPLSEENGLIVPIGRWVLEEACWDLVRWKKHLNDHLPIFMSVNISSKQFLRPSLISEIQEILQETGVSPSELKLEITETALVENTEQTIDLIQRLKQIGIQIVIDDFGTGYSSMSYLQQFPIDTLKVDRSFVSRLRNTSDENKNIVETIIALAHKLKMNVVAEGVETSEQQLVLTGMKCQLAQGYWFSKPLEKEKMMRLVQNIQKLMLENPKAMYKLKKLI